MIAPANNQTIELIMGDCLIEMPKMTRKFQAIITDPPYNVSKKTVITRGAGTFWKGTDMNLDFGDWDHDVVKWEDYIDIFHDLLDENGVLIMFYDKLYLGSIGQYLADKYGYQVRHIGTVVKKNPPPQARKVKWQNGTEMFLIATKNKGMGHHFNYKLGQSPDYIVIDINYKHFHPTQKSPDVMEWLVKYWTFEGDWVLDPFMGAGTTGIVSKKLLRNFIGIEKNKDFFEIAKKKIDQTPPGLQLSLDGVIAF